MVNPHFHVLNHSYYAILSVQNTIIHIFLKAPQLVKPGLINTGSLRKQHITWQGVLTSRFLKTPSSPHIENKSRKQIQIVIIVHFSKGFYIKCFYISALKDVQHQNEYFNPSNNQRVYETNHTWYLCVLS